MRKWISGLIVLTAFVATASVYGNLPDRMPIHWQGLNGTPDGWANRLVGGFVPPVALLVLWVFMLVTPSLDPRKEDYPKFFESVELVYVMFLLLGLTAHLMGLALALGYDVPVRRVLHVGLGLFAFGFGNVLPRIRTNSFVGFRTHRSMSDERTWTRTHRLGGYLFFVAGALQLIAAGASSRALTMLAMLSLLVAFAGTYLYSAVASD